GLSLEDLSSVGQSSFGQRQEEGISTSNAFDLLMGGIFLDSIVPVSSPVIQVTGSKPITRSNFRVDVGKDLTPKGRKSNKEKRETL
ncbi:hypothetical protein KI387_023885, partial [Taxus chinensis]